MSRQRGLDVVCLGRAGVDLYGDQVGGRLEDMAGFSKYVGGCAANIAIACARLGLKPALLTRVGDDHMGRFIRETMAAEHVDVSHVHTDQDRLTALVILGIRDRETFPLIFYRENCADMALNVADLNDELIASAKALLITGTHLSTPGTSATTRAAIAMAKQHGVQVVFDIDYRPVLWGLTGKGLGEERYVEDAAVSKVIQSVVPACDVIVGTEEEFHIAGGLPDTLKALKALRSQTGATFIVKLGSRGCAVLTTIIPDGRLDARVVPGFPVDVYNVLGAGDAFMGGLLRGYLRGKDWQTACSMANAAGAIVVSRHGCSPATATWQELRHFMAHGSSYHRLREDPVLNRLHWSTTRTGEFQEVLAFAFDHRRQLELLAEQHGRSCEAIGRFKSLCWTTVEQVAESFPGNGLGILCDGRLGEDALAVATECAAAKGVWIGRPIEEPSVRPLRFEGAASVGVTLREWPVNHCVKCLVFYHPDDDELMRGEQESALLRLADATRATRHELLLEVITPEAMPRDEQTIARIISRFYEIGLYPDWWKLPPPLTDHEWKILAEVIYGYDKLCRGVVLLGLDAPIEEVRDAVANAANHQICRGFAVGRTIFGEVARNWFAGSMGDDAAVHNMVQRYSSLIEAWNESRLLSGPGKAKAKL